MLAELSEDEATGEIAKFAACGRRLMFPLYSAILRPSSAGWNGLGPLSAPHFLQVQRRVPAGELRPI